MADLASSAAPRALTFGALQLRGFLVSFSGENRRRFVAHEFFKRAGARVEDGERGPRRRTYRLQFLGATAQQDFAAFAAAVDQNPFGLLRDPTEGEFFAFCEGPDYNVDFARAVNQVECNCRFVESELDVAVSADPPDPSTAAQNLSGQQTAFQQSTASAMAVIAKAQITVGTSLAAIDSAVSQISSASAPVDFMRSTISALQGAGSSLIGALAGIQAQADLLVQDVTNLAAAATVLFTGADTVSTGNADSIATALGIVQTDALQLESLLMAASPSAAAVADAVADLELLVDLSQTMSDAVQASIPPVTTYTVPATASVIVIAQQLIQRAGATSDVLAVASQVMALNKIPNPGAVPGGTVLFVPSLGG